MTMDLKDIFKLKSIKLEKIQQLIEFGDHEEIYFNIDYVSDTVIKLSASNCIDKEFISYLNNSFQIVNICIRKNKLIVTLIY